MCVIVLGTILVWLPMVIFFHDYKDLIFVVFVHYLIHQQILFAKLITVCEGLKFITQLGFISLEVEFDSANVFVWISSQFPWLGHRDYAYLLA